jgi:hypothetical protein
MLIPEQVIELWTAALLSGRFPPIPGDRAKAEKPLRCGEARSALGVLCELYLLAGEDAEWKQRHLVWTFHAPTTEGGWRYALPPAVRQWAGIPTATAVLAPRGRPRAARVSVASLDDQGVPFEEIARRIAKHREEQHD